MHQVRGNRRPVVIGNMRRLGGASALAILAAGFGAAPAFAQEVPGGPQCPVVANVVTCSGSLPGGIAVGSGSYEGLDVRNVTGDMAATNRAVIRYVAGIPATTINLNDSDSTARLTTVQGTGAAQLVGAVDLRAIGNTNFSLTSNMNIAIGEQAVVNGRAIFVPVGILVQGSGGTFSIANTGNISLTGITDSASGGILANVFGADLLRISNTGAITGSDDSYGILAAADNRRVELVNDGSITGGNGTAIDLIYSPVRSSVATPGFSRPGTPTTALESYSIVNNGLLESGALFGIRVRTSTSTGAGSFGTPSGIITNNGTIRAGAFGIVVVSEGDRLVVNNGLIESLPASFQMLAAVQMTRPDSSTPITAATVRVENSASGIIQGASYGFDIRDIPATLVNAGRMSVINGGFLISNGQTESGLTRIENTGTVSVTNINGRGIDFSASADAYLASVFNSGLFEATGTNAIGMKFFNVGANAQVAIDLTASSILRGGSGTGSAISFTGGAHNVVTNAGLITAASGTAIVGGSGAETIDNRGRIEGSVSLGAGEDRVIARDGGLFTGPVDGGDGSDTLAYDVTSGSVSIGDRIAGTISGFELLEKTGAGTLTLTEAVAPRAALLGGTLATAGDLGAVAVDASAGTTLNASGRLGAVTIAGGATFSPGGGAVGTIEVASLALAADSHLRFDLGAPGTIGGAVNDLVNVTGNLTLDGILDVNAQPGFGVGVYRLINYGGALTDNGLVLGAAPAASYVVQTSVAGQVNLIVGAFSGMQFWDGGDTTADGVVDGGSGTWNNSTTNWTDAGGVANAPWGGSFAIFQGAPGTVTIDAGGVSASGLQFAVSGYQMQGGSLTLTAPATVRVGDGSAAGAGYTATIASIVTGTGGIDKTDLGTLVLTGANTYSGGTRISGGVVQIGADNNLGAAGAGVTLDGGALRFGATLSSGRGFTVGAAGGTLDTLANAITLSGALSGTGGLTKTGGGILTYSGNGSGYSGRFTIAGGSLRLDGSLGGTLQVNAGARLSGGGTLGNLDLLGTLAPGASVGMLAATGNAIFRAGSVFEVEIAAAGGTDRLTVAGTATIEGGTVKVIALDPETQYVDGASYTFLTATGGITGAFSGISESSAFLDFTLGYGANSASLTVDVVRTFPDVARTFNQRQASTALAAFGQGAGSDSLAVYNQLLMLGEDPARAAFDAASGEIYPVLLASTLRHGAGRADRLLGRARDTGGDGWSLWGSANGHDGRAQSDGNGARYTQDGLGGEIGIDFRGPGNGWAIGFGGGYDDRDVDLRDRASQADVTGWHAGGFARYGTGGAGFTVTAAGAFSRGDANVARAIVFGAIARVATARIDVNGWALGGELRYGWALGGGWSLGPVAHINHARAELGRFAETGANSLNLAGGPNDDLRTRFGGGLFAHWDGAAGTIDATMSYVDGGRDTTEAALVMAGAPAAAYRVRSAQGDGGGLELTLAGRYALGEGWSLGANVEGAAGSSESYLQGSATLGWRF